MNQNIWGPHFWFMLHSISFNYPINPTEENKKDIKKFLLMLPKVLPCSKCCKNFKKNLIEMPIKYNSRLELFKWLIDIHNEINGREGKKHYSYKEVLLMYEKVYGKKIKLVNKNKENNIKISNNNNNNISLLLIILLYLYLIYYLFK